MKIKYKLKPEIKEMAKLEDILTLERGRSDRKEFQTLHLYLEGNFYHLYEVSAWMFNQRIEGKYKITHTQPSPWSVLAEKTGGCSGTEITDNS